MLLINEITSAPKQAHTLIVENNGRVRLTLEFKPQQNGWFFSLVWEDFATYNERVNVSPNILRQYQDIVPFGIAVISNNGQDPMTQDAFESGTAQLFLLSKTEVQGVEAYYYGE